MPELSKLDQPLVFLILVTFGVIAMMALFSWAFTALGWTGPLSLIKGGVA
jgi:hypothetical protein